MVQCALRYKPEVSGYDSRCCQWNFLLTAGLHWNALRVRFIAIATNRICVTWYYCVDWWRIRTWRACEAYWKNDACRSKLRRRTALGRMIGCTGRREAEQHCRGRRTPLKCRGRTAAEQHSRGRRAPPKSDSSKLLELSTLSIRNTVYHQWYE